MAMEIRLPNFDGPLDLLLHLIKTNEMDISDIEVGAITKQYLAIIEQMTQMNLDVAGEFLLMSATLIHIKSRMLLPAPDELEADEEDLDPRAELVRRLLEYQRYKDAALCLDGLPCLNREIFIRAYLETAGEAEAESLHDLGVYHLAAALRRLLQASKVEAIHEVAREQLSVADFIQRILGQLAGGEPLAFGDFFQGGAGRQAIVVTFLAMLELVKMRMITISQSAEFQPVWLRLAVNEIKTTPTEFKEGAFGYG